MAKRIDLSLEHGRRLVVEGGAVRVFALTRDEFGMMYYRRLVSLRLMTPMETATIDAAGGIGSVESTFLAGIVDELARRLSEALAVRGMATEGTESTEGAVDDVDGVDGVGMDFEGPVVGFSGVRRVEGEHPKTSAGVARGDYEEVTLEGPVVVLMPRASWPGTASDSAGEV